MDFVPLTLIRYILSKRKTAEWPKLGKNALKLKSPLIGLEESDFEVLESVYIELGITLDEYLMQDAAATHMQQLFEHMTGKNIDQWQLVAAMTTKRKRGEWVKLKDITPPTAKPFSDFNEVIPKEANG